MRATPGLASTSPLRLVSGPGGDDDERRVGEESQEDGDGAASRRALPFSTARSGIRLDPEVPLPAGYPELLEELKSNVADVRWRAQS